MPYGTGPVLRQALMQATPWQRYLLTALMVAAGVALVLVGHVAGALLAVAGATLLGRMVRHRLRQKPVPPTMERTNSRWAPPPPPGPDQ